MDSSLSGVSAFCRKWQRVARRRPGKRRVVASAYRWERFDKVWLRILQNHGLNFPHMLDIAHRKGELSAWGREERGGENCSPSLSA